MKKSVLVVAVALMLSASAFAEEGKRKFSEKQLAQHQVMRDCNASAKTQGLKGADRKAFMKTCLSSKKGSMAATPSEPAAESSAEKATQKEKMKSCNASAKEKSLKGEERKTFMSTCLAA